MSGALTKSYYMNAEKWWMGENSVASYFYLLKISIKQKIKKLKETEHGSVILNITTWRFLPKTWGRKCAHH